MLNLKMNQIWLLQRISSFLILCLLPAMLFSISEWTTLEIKVLPHWFTFGRAVLFGIFMSCIFIHSFLGIDIIIEDYVPKKWREKALSFSKWFHLGLLLTTWVTLIILIVRGSR